MQSDRDTREKFVPFIGFALLIALVCAAIPIQNHHHQKVLLQCLGNVKTIGLAFKIYMNEHNGYFPQLTSKPGVLSPEPTEIEDLKSYFDARHEYGEFSSSRFVSPAHPMSRKMLEEMKTDPLSAVNDDSYWYLGYYIANEEEGLAFVETYRNKVRSGEPLNWTKNLETSVGPILRLSELNYLELIYKEMRLGVGHQGQANHIPRQIVFASADRSRESTGTESRKTGRFNVALSLAHPPSHFPILIERPNLHKGGAHVLYHDGRVEFMKYPGEFPMTEKFIQALESLDDLKEAR